MRYPRKLEKGGVIGLVSPCSPVSKERKEQCVETIQGMGFRVKAADNISFSKGGFMAGEEKVRAEWVNKMFADPEVDAIFCIRGGDGGNRIIEYLDKDVIKRNPKIFLGYSDVTSLHLFLNQECGLITFHGPMVSSNMVDSFEQESKEALFEALSIKDVYEYKAPEGQEIKIGREGRAEGVITGGNMELISASLKTPYEIETEGRILFIEEVNAHIGNFDRHIYQLRNSGLLQKVRGVILGQFTKGRYDDESYKEPRSVLDALGDLDIPVMYNIQSGHGSPMITIPLGAECAMDTKTKTITFKEGR